MPFCKACNKKCYNSDYCFLHKKSKPMKRTRLRTKGKKARKWAKTRREVIDERPPESCYIGGGKLTLNKDELNSGTFWAYPEHKESKARRPDLANDKDNIDWACGKHNADKGSRSAEEYLNSDPDLRCGEY